MKKMFVTVFIVTAVLSVNAQNLSLGPVASFNHSWITGASENGRKFNPGFKAGATITYSIDPHWAIGSDVVFANEGAKSVNTGSLLETTNKINLNYIRVPLKGIYFFGNLGDKLRPKLYAGPSFGFLVGGKNKYEVKTLSSGAVTSTETPSKDNFKSFDLGAMVGAGLNYRICNATWLNFDVNYTNGLTDITKGSTAWNANRNLGVSAGVTFPIGTVHPIK